MNVTVKGSLRREIVIPKSAKQRVFCAGTMRLTNWRKNFCPLLMIARSTLWPCVSPSLAVINRMILEMIPITLLRAPGLAKSALAFAIEASKSFTTWSALAGFSSLHFLDNVDTELRPLGANRGEAATDCEAPPSLAASNFLILIRYAADDANSLLEVQGVPIPPASVSRPCTSVEVTDMSPPKLPVRAMSSTSFSSAANAAAAPSPTELLEGRALTTETLWGVETVSLLPLSEGRASTTEMLWGVETVSPPPASVTLPAT
mmetsp:Transcript_3521/g.8136  ORF Transcript_3521/g.8136 Transcript_3521/m.8136 type:complete len:261 (-) Transcript_3521:237-1019(-)